MGTYNKGIQGPFSGKVGTVVGASWRGVDYMRSLSKRSKVKPTAAQKAQRLKFALISGWLKPLRALIWEGYQNFTGTKTPMNGAISFHLKQAICGDAPDYNIDFPNAVFSRGELLISFIKKVQGLTNAILNVKWSDATETAFCRPDDRAVFIVYNPLKGQFVTFENAAQRADAEVKLQMPAGFAGDLVHCWMHYVNAACDAVSTGIYVGAMEIKP